MSRQKRIEEKMAYAAECLKKKGKKKVAKKAEKKEPKKEKKIKRWSKS